VKQAGIIGITCLPAFTSQDDNSGMQRLSMIMTWAWCRVSRHLDNRLWWTKHQRWRERICSVDVDGVGIFIMASGDSDGKNILA